MRQISFMATLSIVSILLFFSPATQAQDIIEDAQPVTIVDTIEEPVVPIPEGTILVRAEDGSFLTNEEINTLQEFTSVTMVIDEAASQGEKLYSMRLAPANMVLCLPIQIFDNKGNKEKTVIYSSPLSGGIASCVLPPFNTPLRCGNITYTLRCSLNDIQLCPIANLQYGCCEVNGKIKIFGREITIQFCFNSPGSFLCEVLNKWMVNCGIGTASWTPEGRCNYKVGYCDKDIPTAVIIASLAAKAGNNMATISWQTGDEASTFGFNLYRSESKDGGFSKINDAIIRAKASAGVGADYSFVDKGLNNRTAYYYMIQDVASDGTQTMHDDMTVSVVPSLFAR